MLIRKAQWKDYEKFKEYYQDIKQNILYLDDYGAFSRCIDENEQKKIYDFFCDDEVIERISECDFELFESYKKNTYMITRLNQKTEVIYGYIVFNKGKDNKVKISEIALKNGRYITKKILRGIINAILVELEPDSIWFMTTNKKLRMMLYELGFIPEEGKELYSMIKKVK